MGKPVMSNKSCGNNTLCEYSIITEFDSKKCAALLQSHPCNKDCKRLCLCQPLQRLTLGRYHMMIMPKLIWSYSRNTGHYRMAADKILRITLSGILESAQVKPEWRSSSSRGLNELSETC